MRDKIVVKPFDGHFKHQLKAVTDCLKLFQKKLTEIEENYCIDCGG